MADLLQAARVGDQLAHSSRNGWMGLLGAVIGAVVGAALAAVAIVAVIGLSAAATIFTGGLAAPLVVCAVGAVVTGALSMGVTGALMASKDTHGSPSSSCGKIATGSPNVKIENAFAARAGIDTESHDGKLIAFGTKHVYVNGKLLARLNDKGQCGGLITTSASHCAVGGESTQVVEKVEEGSDTLWGIRVSSLETFGTWMGYANQAFMVPFCGLFKVVGGFFASKYLGIGGTWLGNKIGGKWGGRVGGFLGSFIGGVVGSKGAEGIGRATLPGARGFSEGVINFEANAARATEAAAAKAGKDLAPALEEGAEGAENAANAEKSAANAADEAAADTTAKCETCSPGEDSPPAANDNEPAANDNEPAGGKGEGEGEGEGDKKEGGDEGDEEGEKDEDEDENKNFLHKANEFWEEKVEGNIQKGFEKGTAAVGKGINKATTPEPLIGLDGEEIPMGEGWNIKPVQQWARSVVPYAERFWASKGGLWSMFRNGRLADESYTQFMQRMGRNTAMFCRSCSPDLEVDMEPYEAIERELTDAEVWAKLPIKELPEKINVGFENQEKLDQKNEENETKEKVEENETEEKSVEKEQDEVNEEAKKYGEETEEWNKKLEEGGEGGEGGESGEGGKSGGGEGGGEGITKLPPTGTGGHE